MAITTNIDFPEIQVNGFTINPDVDFKEMYEDSTIRTATESGYVITRKRYTRDRKIFEVKFAMIPNDQKEILDEFVRDIVQQGALIFNWVHPVSQIVYQVRFIAVPQYTYAGMNGKQPAWDFSFKIQEA